MTEPINEEKTQELSEIDNLFRMIRDSDPQNQIKFAESKFVSFTLENANITVTGNRYETCDIQTVYSCLTSVDAYVNILELIFNEKTLVTERTIYLDHRSSFELDDYNIHNRLCISIYGENKQRFVYYPQLTEREKNQVDCNKHIEHLYSSLKWYKDTFNSSNEHYRPGQE